MDFGPNTAEDTKNYVKSMIAAQDDNPRVHYEFAITLRDKGTLVGGCGLGLERPHEASIGYCLNPNFWGYGLATEAALALCQFGFSKLLLHRIFATCRLENVASARVMEKLGMKWEGLLREHVYVRGQWHDSYLYSILVHEFAESVR